MAQARSGNRVISVWGAASTVKVGDDIYALFMNDVYGPDGPVLEVRTVALDAPDSLSTPVQSYQFNNVWEVVVFLDEESDTWFMYYRGFDYEHYGEEIAVADSRETSCQVNSGHISLLLSNRQSLPNRPPVYALLLELPMALIVTLPV